MASEIYFVITPREGGFRALCKSSGNRELIWWTEVYPDKRDAQHAIDLMQEHAADATVLDITN
jgi:uncharacterized protein YegP (UPF0339 family)